MKQTEMMFKFPIVAYDGIEMVKRERREVESEFLPIEGVMPYVIGYAAIPFEEIRGWTDAWRKGIPIEDINDKIKSGRKGFDSTIVMTETLGDFHCSWIMDKFETKYDEHFEKLSAYYEELANNSIDGEISTQK